MVAPYFQKGLSRQFAKHFGRRGFTNVFCKPKQLGSNDTSAWCSLAHCHHHMCTTMTRLQQHFGRSGFIFGHYNGSRAFVSTFVINAYDDLSSLPSLRATSTPPALRSTSPSLTTSAWASHWHVMFGHLLPLLWYVTASTTPSMIEYMVTSASQEGLGEHRRSIHSRGWSIFAQRTL